MNRRARQFRGAFTLIEMTLSIAIVGIILGAVESLIVLAARSIDNGTSITARAAAGRWAADQVLADARLATTFTAQTSTQLAFSVPDRAGGAGTNTITYAWAGAGNALTRSLNGGTATAMSSNVQSLSFSTRTMTSTVPGPVPAVPTTTAEAAQVTWDTSANGTNTTNYSVTPTAWVAQTFRPTLAGTPMYWSLTHMKLPFKRPSILALGTVYIEIHPVDASFHPTTTVLDSASVDITLMLLGGSWIDVSFSNLTAMDPAQSYAVVVRDAGLTAAVNMTYDYKSVSPAGFVFSTSSGGGSPTWTNSATSTFDMYIYGTVTNP